MGLNMARRMPATLHTNNSHFFRIRCFARSPVTFNAVTDIHAANVVTVSSTIAAASSSSSITSGSSVPDRRLAHKGNLHLKLEGEADKFQ